MLEAQDKQKIQIKQQYSGYYFIYSVDLYIRTYIKKKIVIAVKNVRSDMARQGRGRERRTVVPKPPHLKMS